MSPTLPASLPVDKHAAIVRARRLRGEAVANVFRGLVRWVAHAGR